MNARTRNIALTIGIPVVIVVAVFLWWTRGDAPEEVDIDAAQSAADNPSEVTTTTPATTTTPSVSATSTTAASPQPSQTDAPTTPADDPTTTSEGPVEWTVDSEAVAYDFESSQGTLVGFRIDEELTGDGAVTAVGRTPDVTGMLVQNGSTIERATVTADLTTINSDRSRRNNAIQDALNTSEHPTAEFVLTEPIDLGTTPPEGEPVEAEATGTLTINGVTNDVTLSLQAVLIETDLLAVTGTTEVALSDYDITAPSAPIVVSVADVATVEVQLYLTPG